MLDTIDSFLYSPLNVCSTYVVLRVLDLLFTISGLDDQVEKNNELPAYTEAQLAYFSGMQRRSGRQNFGLRTIFMYISKLKQK